MFHGIKINNFAIEKGNLFFTLLAISYICKMAFQEQLVFIVGNSRSGTTMLMRVLNNHPSVFVLNELHFFEQLWAPEDLNKTISKTEAVTLMSKLLLTQRIGYKTHDQNFHQFDEESRLFIDSLSEEPLTAEFVFTEMIKREAHLHGKTKVCEKTPQNVFYLKEIFEIYPNAKIINMVRDPRAIMLSQKNKWNRRNLGGDYMTKKEALRLRINYHPITISKLWNSAIYAARNFEQDTRVMDMRFEDLVGSPQDSIQKICKHIGIDFHEIMMQITQESSSLEQDSKAVGFKKERASTWRKGGLDKAEVWWNEKLCLDNIRYHQYSLEQPKASMLGIVFYFLTFPVKLILALLFNLDRMKNIFETLKRRWR